MDFEELRKRREGFPTFPKKGREWEEWETIEIDEDKLKTILKPILKEYNLKLDSIEMINEGEWRVISINRLGNNVRSIVWTKYMVSVEKEDIEDIYEEMLHEKAHNAIFITTSHFTKEAQEFAEHLPIKLIDGMTLSELIPESKAIEVDKVFLTDKNDADAIRYFKSMRKRKRLGLFGEDERIEYVDRRYIPFAIYKIVNERGNGEGESNRVFIDLSNGDMPHIEERELVNEDIIRNLMELPDEAREHLLDLINYGDLSFKHIKGKNLEILEKKGFVRVSGKPSGEKSIINIISEEILDTMDIIAINIGNLPLPKEREIRYEKYEHREVVKTPTGERMVRATIKIPQIDHSFDLEHFIKTSTIIDKDFDVDDTGYDVEEIRNVLERIYQNRTEFVGMIYMPYYLCKYKTAYKTRYIRYISPSFDEKVIPKKTPEYEVYRFIDRAPALPYIVLGIAYLFLGLNNMEKTLHVFSSAMIFMFLVIITGIFLKLILRTPRRVPRYWGTPAVYGFPSIHSMLSVGSIGLFYFIDPSVLIILIPLALIYIYSRLAIGVHSMVDVTGGAIIGFIIGILCGIYIYKIDLPTYIETFMTILFFVTPILLTYMERSLR